MARGQLARRAADDVEDRRRLQAVRQRRLGQIELKELTGALKALGLETDEAGAKAVLGRYERKEMHAGLDLAEFTQLVRDVVAWQETQTARNLASDAKCRAAFGKVDADQSGRLDGRELKKALEAMTEISGDWHTRARRSRGMGTADGR